MEQRGHGEAGEGAPNHQHPPVFEGVVDDGFEHQAVPDLRRSPKVEHLDGSQCGVGMAQTTVGTGVGVTPQTYLPPHGTLPNPARDKETPKKCHPLDSNG